MQTEVLLSHTTLPRLVLKKCRGSRLVVRCNALRELVIESCSFLALTFSTPVLTSLELRDCQKIADVGLRAALTRLTALKSLDVSHSVPLSDDTLREARAAPFQLCQHFPGLSCHAHIPDDIAHSCAPQFQAQGHGYFTGHAGGIVCSRSV